MARPDELVRNAPVEPAVVLMTVAVVDALAAGELLAAGAAALVLLALLPAAASGAVATGTPIFTGIGSRVSIELDIFVVSVPGRRSRRPAAGERRAPPSSLACQQIVTETAPKEIAPDGSWRTRTRRRSPGTGHTSAGR